MNENPSIISHVSLGTNHFAQAVAFYDKVLATLNIRRTLDLSEHQAAAYGRAYPEFWIQRPHDGQPAATANGVHVAFFATSRAEVDAGPRPHYGKEYYGCFVRDLDGHKIEAMAWLADA